MAWFGESIANIKGQISSFTKEVLAEDEDADQLQNEGQSNDELIATKKAFVDLQEFCGKQKKEIERLKLLSEEFEKKANTFEEQNKSIGDSYQKLIQDRDEENKTLQFKIKELESKEKEVFQVQQQYIEEIRKEYEAKSWVSVESEPDPAERKSSSSAINAATQTLEQVSIETCEVETLTDFPLKEEEDEATKAEEESYRRELEERCTAYQQDLYVLRGELMTIQSDSDQEEELRAKFNEDVINILYSDFVTDGHAALTKLKCSRPDSTRGGEEVILAALRQLAAVWRTIIDQKNSLEGTVTKLSSHHHQSPVSSTTSEVDIVELPNDCHFEGGDSCNSEDFFPQRLDSFGLETILEEEKNDEDSKHDSEDVDLARQSKTSSVEVPSKLEVEVTSSLTQTEEECPEVNLEALRAEILATLESAYVEKERVWSEADQQRQIKITRLQSELERLKTHLVEMEDQHTGEMLACEEKEKELKTQINELQQQISRVLQHREASADIKEEILRLESERDFTKAQCSSYEDQIHKLGVQLQNLNFVLEQFQKEKEQEIEGIRQQLASEIHHLHIANKKLGDELRGERELLDKAKSGLDAARQLNLQLEEKSRVITTLRSQLQEGEVEVTKLKSQLDEVSNNNVAKIDRYLVKNLVVGYFSTPPDKRQEVLRIIATVLDFNREDRQKTGLESTSLWPFRSETASSGDSNQSLSQAFIKFLETESQPKAQIKISMEEIARKHSRTLSESSTASSTSHPTEISMTLPVLNQADRSNSILKDVLNPKT